MKINYFCSK